MTPLYLGTDRVCHDGDVYDTLRLVQALADRTVPGCAARIYRDDWAVPHIIVTVPGEEDWPLVLQRGQWLVVGPRGELRIEGRA
jgi:hypothetical protein